MVMNEAVIFNYWHLTSADKTKLWNLHVVCFLTYPFLDEHLPMITQLIVAMSIPGSRTY
jgi:hypothetical protein